MPSIHIKYYFYYNLNAVSQCSCYYRVMSVVAFKTDESFWCRSPGMIGKSKQSLEQCQRPRSRSLAQEFSIPKAFARALQSPQAGYVMFLKSAACYFIDPEFISSFREGSTRRRRQLIRSSWTPVSTLRGRHSQTAVGPVGHGGMRGRKHENRLLGLHPAPSATGSHRSRDPSPPDTASFSE